MKIFCILMILAVNAYAVKESEYEALYDSAVTPYFSQGAQRSFVNGQGLKLNFYSFTAEVNSKTLVILPGRSEPAMKYAEIVYDLKDEGFNIFILDHQGQGFSDRLLADTHKGYVRRFGDYTNDLRDWLNQIVIPETKNQERFVLAHSMGGAIGAHYLALNTGLFKKAVLCSPMLEINTKPYSEGIARVLAASLSTVGFAKKYAPDRGPYNAEADVFEINELSHSPLRWATIKNIFIENPEVVVGGPTNRWVSESLKATRKIDTLASRVSTPVLMFQAGQDTIVKLGRQDSYCDKHKNCEKLHFPYSRHEILFETDDIREVAMQAMKNFFK